MANSLKKDAPFYLPPPMPETPHFMVRPARWCTDEAGLARVRRQGYSGVRLPAQTHALPFYMRYGFQPVGEIYQDANIPHLAMSFTFKGL